MINLIVGLGGKIDYTYIIKLLNLGVREFFIGFIPGYWSDEYGYSISPNRRYSKDFQIESIKEFVILTKFLKKYDSKIFFTLNEHNYTNENFVLIKRILDDVMNYVDGIIVGNLGLLSYIRNKSKYNNLQVHISGDNFTLNKYSLDGFVNAGANRIILPRNITLSEITDIAHYRNEKHPDIELELFIGDSLLYNCGLCTFFHGSEQYHFCRDNELNLRNLHYLKGGETVHFGIDFDKEVGERDCSLCFIQNFIDLGINSFKIPGRTGNLAFVINKVINVKKYLNENIGVSKKGKIELKEHDNCMLKKCIYEI